MEGTQSLWEISKGSKRNTVNSLSYPTYSLLNLYCYTNVDLQIVVHGSHTGNTKKQLNIAEMKLKLEGLQTESSRLRLMNFKANTLITNFQHDFYELTQLIQEPQALKDAVKTLSQKYETNKGKIMPVDEDLQKEIGRQREYLERNVANLQHKLSKDRLVHQKNHQRIMQENVVLIKELNEMRKELKLIKMGGQRPPPFKSEDGSATDNEGVRSRIKVLQLELASEKESRKRLELLLEEATANIKRNMTPVEPSTKENLECSEMEKMERKIEELELALVQKEECMEALKNSLQGMTDKSNVVQVNITVRGKDMNTEASVQDLGMGHSEIGLEDSFEPNRLTGAGPTTETQVRVTKTGVKVGEDYEDEQSSSGIVEDI
eukprot:Gb_40930 [translate_table: standard]